MPRSRAIERGTTTSVAVRVLVRIAASMSSINGVRGRRIGSENPTSRPEYLALFSGRNGRDALSLLGGADHERQSTGLVGG